MTIGLHEYLISYSIQWGEFEMPFLHLGVSVIGLPFSSTLVLALIIFSLPYLCFTFHFL